MIYALIGLIVLMSATWAWARKIDNYSIIDPVWALSFALTAWFYALHEDGTPSRRALIAGLVTAWSLRLGFFLTRRTWSHHPKEDGRYKELRKGYGDHVARGFFGFFQVQALSVAALSIPFFLIARNSDLELAPLEIIGAILFVLSLAGEALADRQMGAFKKAHPDRVCDAGLWRYSRHPNYFFEACIWFSFYVMALASPYGVYTIYAPAFMLYILLMVTGVPPSEAQSLRTRGDAYRAYQRRTSKFFPWFPKEDGA